MSTTGETLALDNNRPVEVTYIPEATFDDILDIGVAKLAVRDATVIEHITEPGYDEFLGEVSGFVARKAWMRGVARRPILKFVESHPFYDRMKEFNEELFRNVSDGGRMSFMTPILNTGLGFPPDHWGNRAHSPHTDINVSGLPQITVNFTFYHASSEPWFWRLTPDALVDSHDAHFKQPSVDVPLTPPGCVVLGENSRQFEIGKPRTPGHQVISPPTAWKGSKVQRVRALVISG